VKQRGPNGNASGYGMLGISELACPAIARPAEIFSIAGSEEGKKGGTPGLANEIIRHVSAWGKRWRLAAELQRARHVRDRIVEFIHWRRASRHRLSRFAE
jgi:hypothetical protein